MKRPVSHIVLADLHLALSQIEDESSRVPLMDLLDELRHGYSMSKDLWRDLTLEPLEKLLRDAGFKVYRARHHEASSVEVAWIDF